MMHFSFPDPYVKIYLLYNDQRIAKKKTHVKKRTLNPVFNESFVFELPHLEEGLKNISLEFALLDWDRVTKNEVMEPRKFSQHEMVFFSFEQHLLETISKDLSSGLRKTGEGWQSQRIFFGLAESMVIRMIYSTCIKLMNLLL